MAARLWRPWDDNDNTEKEEKTLKKIQIGNIRRNADGRVKCSSIS